MNGRYIVAQSNELITARHNNPLTSRESKIILAMVSEIQPDDEDFKEYRISLKDFNDLLGLKGKTKYTQMREVIENLMNKTIRVQLKNNGWLLVHWVSSAQYVDGSGVIELSFSPKLKPYLLQLKQYTSYKLSNILALNSTYSIRLYEIMKRWSFAVNWECTLEDLKEMIGIQENEYKQYGHFKSRVLKRAVDEVNEKTDLKILFEEIKIGRTVAKIKFTILKSSTPAIEPSKKEEQEEQEETLPENVDVRNRLNSLADKELYQFTQNYFSQMYQGATLIWGEKAEDELVMIIGYVNVERSVKNPLGFIKSQIQLAWEAYERGEHITFADLQPTKERTTGREQVLPDWFKKSSKDNEPKKEKGSESEQEKDKTEIENEREELIKELAEMEKKRNKKNHE